MDACCRRPTLRPPLRLDRLWFNVKRAEAEGILALPKKLPMDDSPCVEQMLTDPRFAQLGQSHIEFDHRGRDWAACLQDEGSCTLFAVRLHTPEMWCGQIRCNKPLYVFLQAPAVCSIAA